MPTQARTDIEDRVARIQGLVETLSAGPDPDARSQVEELVAGVLDLHGTALRRMLDIVGGDGGSGRLRALANDDLVSGMLLIHDLHPVSLRDRVESALESVRPLMHSHKGDIELIGIEDDIVRLRLQGTCHGCAASAVTMRDAVEKAIHEIAPDVADIEVEGVVDEDVSKPPDIDCLIPLSLTPVAAAGT